MKPINNINDVVAFVEHNDPATFAEIAKHVPFDPKIDSDKFAFWFAGKLLWEDRLNVVELLAATAASKRVCISLVPPMTLYTYDGGPVPDKRDWLPVAFRPARYGRAFGKAPFLFDNKDANTGEKIVIKERGALT